MSFQYDLFFRQVACIFQSGVFGANLAETVPGDIVSQPLVNESLAGSLVIGRILDSLVTLDPVDGTVIPNLAKSWKYLRIVCNILSIYERVFIE